MRNEKAGAVIAAAKGEGRDAFYAAKKGYIAMAIILAAAWFLVTHAVPSTAALKDANLVALSGLLMQLVLAIAANVLLASPLSVATWRFCLKNTTEQRGASVLECIKSAFGKQYGTTVATAFQMTAKIGIGLLMLVVPGYMRMYDFRFAYAILAEDQTIAPDVALATSAELMYGHRIEAFLLDLSFVGWLVLSRATFGLVGVLFLLPYKIATDAAYYRYVTGCHTAIRRI